MTKKRIFRIPQVLIAVHSRSYVFFLFLAVISCMVHMKSRQQVALMVFVRESLVRGKTFSPLRHS